MPDWTNYFAGFAAGTSTSDGWVNMSIPSVTQIRQDYEEYQRECERQDQVYEQQMQMMEQQMEEERQLAKDKKKYPLFFLKEGIV